jgi:hypothetical protein
MAAVEATDVLEKNQMLTVRAMKGLHGSVPAQALLKEPFRLRFVSLQGVKFDRTGDARLLGPNAEDPLMNMAPQSLSELELSRGRATPESPVSAVSWAAIFAGAFVAAAVSLALIALGSGFGLASVSPWPGGGVSGSTFTIMTAIWLIAVQWLASGLGGYIAGRLRTKWANLHTHEVFFRDTAHGLITWATATIFVAMFLAVSVFLASHVDVQTTDASVTAVDVDVARSAAAQASLYTGFSMLIGAFIACISASLGGRRRDEHN